MVGWFSPELLDELEEELEDDDNDDDDLDDEELDSLDESALVTSEKDDESDFFLRELLTSLTSQAAAKEADKSKMISLLNLPIFITSSFRKDYFQKLYFF